MLRTLRSATLRRQSVRPRALLPLCQRRHFFGLGEIISVISNPAETLRQINESKQMLKEAKQELELSREQQKIPQKHTFSRLPGFHGRKEEQNYLHRILKADPGMTLVFGGTSVGKTALLRQVLAGDEHFVVNMDLRISGFASTRTLYESLCDQFQRFFEGMHHETTDRHALMFKHMLLALTEKDEKTNYQNEVGAAEIASLMEAFQSCLLGYWEFDPRKDEEAAAKAAKEPKERTKQLRMIDPTVEQDEEDPQDKVSDQDKPEGEDGEGQQKKAPWRKRSVVFFIDEAHKLPALIQDELVQKVFLDSLLVLTKQDRLCHVLMATSDSFFQHYLRAMNVSHHASCITIGDCDRHSTYDFFMDELITKVPAFLRPKVDFQGMHDVFGGKLAHITDYLNSWIQSEGKLTPLTSPQFLQAYTLLQVHLANDSFETWSSLPDVYPRKDAGIGPAVDPGSGNSPTRQFTRRQLLEVMELLVDTPHSVPYFDLCRKYGQSAVDALIRTRILELRWTEPIVNEDVDLDAQPNPWQVDGVLRPLVVPMTKVLRVAMQVILNEEKYFAMKEREQRTKGEDERQKQGQGGHVQEGDTGSEAEKVTNLMYGKQATWRETPFDGTRK